YANNSDTAVTSRSVSLEGLSGSKLIFDAKYATENKYDTVKAEVSSDGGKTWSAEASYSGSSDWKQQAVDLSKYDGKNIQFRFRLTSDGSVSGDGFSFANAVIAGGN
ncbi:MAG: immune inhibitor A, partial [Candidatus Eremiobacteraeota bacterium]|nr:immune inhibitor A [Candidatus Eremiobacteraeota bacterium]